MRTDMSKWKRRIMAFLTAFLIMLCAAGTEALQVQADEKTASGNDESGGETTDTEEDDEDPGPSSTSEFLSLSDTYQTPTVTYGETVLIALPVVNYSSVPLKDVIVKPRISNLVSEWPFEPNSAGATKAIKSFPAYDNKKNMEEVRQDLGFVFVVRSDVKSGYYKLEFDATYTRDGMVEKALLTTYVKAVGKPESGTLDGDADSVARGLDQAHTEASSILNYNDENSLACAIGLAYYSARKDYRLIRELPSGKGVADVVYLPKRKSMLPAMIVELKWDKSSEGAIGQIKQRNYPVVLQDYGGEIVMVGIGYNPKTKVHTCEIERI